MFNPESGSRPEEDMISPEVQGEKTEIEKQIDAEESRLTKNTEQMENNFAEVEILEAQEPANGWGSKVKKAFKEVSGFVSDNFWPEIAGGVGGAIFSGTETGSLERFGAMAVGAAVAVASKYALKFGKKSINR